MRRTRFANAFSFLFSCSKSAATVCAAGVSACGDLPKQFGQERVQLGELDLVLTPANFHVSTPSREWRAGDNRVVVAHKVRPAHACRSTRPIGLCDALPTCVSLLSRGDSQRRVGKPWSHSSSNLRDRCGPPPARERQDLLRNALLFRWWAPPS